MKTHLEDSHNNEGEWIKNEDFKKMFPTLKFYKMRVIKTKDTKDHLCRYCQNDFPTCPKANHIKFGDGFGDNVIECSEFAVTSYFNNFPIEGTDIFAKRVDLNFP